MVSLAWRTVVLQLFANVMALARERNTTNMSAKKGLSEKTGILGT
jgi:hypothetical protein